MAAPDPYFDALAVLSGNLHRAMQDKGMSVRELARLSGMDSRPIRNILQFPHAAGSCNPSVRTVALLASALGVPFATLFISSLSPRT